jgi:pyridinium-3,5-biscarboxylic acid mononucleotide sulfurtransferase
MTHGIDAKEAALARVLDEIGEVAIAVSGGVDSMTLAFIAGRRLGLRAEMIHAVSPAVPPEATERVRRYAGREAWRLDLIDAGEFDDPDYLRNPANRCFFCKANLYGTIARRTRARILSGTNLDDLGDYRPGLKAAENNGVVHPYVEAGIDKASVRALARRRGLSDLAELPAAPCLSSRLETGLRVTGEALGLVHAVERLLSRSLAPKTVRCRLFRDSIAIQLDAEGLDRIQALEAEPVRRKIETLVRTHGEARPIRFEAYRMGSAFHRPAGHG